MTGSATLERDLEQLTSMLDDSPAIKCDYKGTMFQPMNCEKDATYRIRLRCGHGWNTCTEHVDQARQTEHPHHCGCGAWTDAGDVAVIEL
jgi:hypothetical protein